MKKLLITSLLGLFGFVGAFASAIDIATFTSDGSSYTPTTITFSSDYVITEDIFSSVSCDSECNITIVNSSDDCSINYFWAGTEDNGSFEWDISNGDNECSFTAGTYNIYKQEGSNYFDSISLIVPSSGGGDNSGGSLLPNGESDLSGIITGLNSTITEFIPYLVYLGLGIITVIIGFVAVRWLINRTQAKIRGTFNSGRRR